MNHFEPYPQPASEMTVLEYPFKPAPVASEAPVPVIESSFRDQVEQGKISDEEMITHMREGQGRALPVVKP